MVGTEFPKLEDGFSAASDPSFLCRSWERRNQLSSESNGGRSSKTPDKSASSEAAALGDKLISSKDPDQPRDESHLRDPRKMKMIVIWKGGVIENQLVEVRVTDSSNDLFCK